MSEAFSAILFDLDGLIVDSESMAFRAWKRICEEQGFSLTEELYLRGVGVGVENLLQLLGETFGSEFHIGRARDRRRDIWTKTLEEDRLDLKPGFEELLSYLEKEQFPRAIATSTERRLVEQRFIAAKLDPKRFHAVVCGDEVPEVKPAPDLYLKAAGLLQVSPQNCLVLEDSGTGAEAAHRAQMRVVVVPDLLAPSERTLSIAHRIEPDLHSVLAWFRAQRNSAAT